MIVISIVPFYRNFLSTRHLEKLASHHRVYELNRVVCPNFGHCCCWWICWESFVDLVGIIADLMGIIADLVGIVTDLMLAICRLLYLKKLSWDRKIYWQSE